MENNEDCVFCKIVRGESPCHKVWEDNDYLAFLSIYPNTEGVTVVIPKRHYPSYAFDLPDKVLARFIVICKLIARRIDLKLEGVCRTAVVMEGYGVDHVHAKLYPLHRTSKSGGWKPIPSKPEDRKYFEVYPGYVCSNDYERADDEKLAALAEKIRSL